jgi:MFS family permease
VRLSRYCAASFIVDGAFYVLWTVIPFLAHRLGADPFQTGLLTVVTGVTYTVVSIFSGWLADRVSRLLLCRAGGVLIATGMVLVSRAQSLQELFFAAPVASMGTAAFWPALQAAIGREAGPAKLARALGSFNVSWSAGKALGFLIGGLALKAYGPSITLLGSAASVGLTLALLPWRDLVDGAAPVMEPEADRPSAFLRAAWIGNFAAYGMGNLINLHYPKYLVTEIRVEAPEHLFGYVACAIFAGQTLAFAILLVSTFWTYRWMPIFSMMGIMAACMTVLPMADGLGAMLAIAFPIGLSLGVGYATSIYYSLHGPRYQGIKVGVHEAIIGSSGVVLPALGGLLARELNDLRWPYWLGALTVLAALGGQLLCRRTNAAR